VVHCSPAVTRYSSSGKSSVEGKMGLKHIGDERNRIRQILALAHTTETGVGTEISVPQFVPLVTHAKRE
jgi:hypothetical protein